MGFISSLFGFGGDTPKTQQVVQATKLPEEIAPFAKEVLDEAKALYTQRMGEGYTPYGGPTIAPLTSEQEQAMAGITGLVGTQRPLQEEALGMFRSGATEKFTPEVAQEYMSPYQRAVTDVEKREAQRDFEGRIMPQFEKQAVGAGGMSGMGSRAGVQAAQLGKTQMERLGDIESKGLQSAYKDAQTLFAQQQAREGKAATAIAGMGPAMFGAGLAEQGALQTVGEQKQALGQEALDEAYFRFLEKQGFPQEQLAGYSGFVYGNPLMQQRTKTTTMPAPMGPSTGQQLMGLGLTAAKLYGMGGGGTEGWGGFSVPTLLQSLGGKKNKTGGRISARTGGGLSSLPVVYRQNSGSLRSDDEDPRQRLFGPHRSSLERHLQLLNLAEHPLPDPSGMESGRYDQSKDAYVLPSKEKPLISRNQRNKTDSEGQSARNMLSVRGEGPATTHSLIKLLQSMGVEIDDLFERRREAVGHPKFGLGAAIAGVLETPQGRQPGLVEAFLRGSQAGFTEYDIGAAKREEALRDIGEDEEAFKLKMALKGAEPFEGKYTEVVRKSLWEHAAYISGEGARFDKDDILRYTNSGNPVGPETQRKVAELFHKLEKAFAHFYELTRDEIKSIGLAKDLVKEDKSPSDNLAGGDNQGTGTAVTPTPGQLKPETLNQTAPGVSSNQPVENDLDYIPDLPR